MKALVTGATGLAGFHLVKRLISENWSVTAMGRNKTKLAQLHELGANPLRFDLTDDYDNFDQLSIYGDHIWFHVAAAIAGASRDILDKVNIQGTNKLVRQAEKLDIPHFILVSSSSTYGTRLSGKVEELVDQNPESYYGLTKLEQENIVKSSTIPFSIVRPPYIGGPYDQNFLVEFAKRVRDSNLPTFSKDGIISYVDARDLASALLIVATSEEAINTCFNVKSDIIYHSEFQQLLGDKLDIDPPYGPHYPYWLAMIVGFFGEIKAKLTGSSAQRGASRYRVRTLCRQFSLDDSKIRDLGFKSRYTIAESIEDWLKENPLSD